MQLIDEDKSFLQKEYGCNKPCSFLIACLIMIQYCLSKDLMNLIEEETHGNLRKCSCSNSIIFEI